jgi:hypothetical protein
MPSGCWHSCELFVSVPNAITVELLDRICDRELPEILYLYVLKAIDESGGYRVGGPHMREVLAGLPFPLALTYRLTVLVGEVYNGGFYQLFTNSSGELVDDILDDLRTIGAETHLALVEKVVALNRQLEERHPIYASRFTDSDSEACGVRDERDDAFWSDVETVFLPEFEQMGSEFSGLDDGWPIDSKADSGNWTVREFAGIDPMWPRLVRFVRAHAADCVHARRTTSPPDHS